MDDDGGEDASGVESGDANVVVNESADDDDNVGCAGDTLSGISENKV